MILGYDFLQMALLALYVGGPREITNREYYEVHNCTNNSRRTCLNAMLATACNNEHVAPALYKTKDQLQCTQRNI